MEKTTDSKIAILITGYNNNKGYSDIISCSDKTLEQDIRSQKVSLKDFRFSLNIVAEGEQIYSIGFTRDWKVYSVYEAYGWSARKVMIGLSLYIRKGYELQGTQKDDIKKLLDELKVKYIRIANYQLDGITPVGAESTAGLSIKSGTSIGSFHNGVYTKGKDGKGYYTYSGSETINKIFSNGYASELQGFREVYLINDSVQYIKPLVEALPTITPKPISKDITIRFLENETQNKVQAYKLGRVLINGEPVASSSGHITWRIEAQSPSLSIRIEDKKYEQISNLIPQTAKEILARDEPYLDILLKPRLYTYTLKCVEAGTRKPIKGVLVQVEYDRNGEAVQYEEETDNSGQIHIPQELTFDQSVSFKPIKYNGTDKNKKFKKEAFQRRIPQRVNSEKNEYTLELKPDEKPKPPPPKTNSQNAGYSKPSAQMGSNSLGGQKQLVFVFEPESATPRNNNIELTYIRNGQELSFRESDYIISGNKLTLNFQDANIDEIKLNVVDGKNYYIKAPVVLNGIQIKEYISGRLSRKVHLERKNSGSNALLKKILNWKTLSALAALLIVGLVGFAIYKFVMTSDDPEVDIEALKSRYLNQVNAIDSIFNQEKAGVDNLLSNAGQKNKEIKKEAEKLSFSHLDEQRENNVSGYRRARGRIKGRIEKISRQVLKDTSQIKEDLNVLNESIDSLQKISANLQDDIIPSIEERLANNKDEDELEKNKLKNRFETLRTYIYGSLKSVDNLRDYEQELSSDRNTFQNAGVDRDRVTNTLALAKKRLEIKDAQYTIRCSTGKAKNCQKKYSSTELNDSINLLKEYASDGDALMPSQRQELQDWFKANDIN